MAFIFHPIFKSPSPSSSPSRNKRLPICTITSGEQTRPHSGPIFNSSTDVQHLLTDIETQRSFLRTAWGVCPILLPNLFPAYDSPVTPDDLAALSSDPSLHSRIIHGATSSDTFSTTTPYTLSLGPFDESIWPTLGQSDWTLLVQGVDQRVPALQSLLDDFAFLPTWRVDDIQASYAVRGGGVGPHVDNYDVFLIQAAGTRRWRISNTPISPDSEQYIPDIDVRVLQTPFQIDGDHVLRAGDVLYVPPRFPHWGVSLDDDCITLSVGFRAPNVSTLLTGWAEFLVNSQNLADKFYKDDILSLCQHVDDPGRISNRAIDDAFNLLQCSFKNDESTRRQFANWFVEHVSQRKTFTEEDDNEMEGVMKQTDLDHAMNRLIDDSKSNTDESETLVIRQRQGTVFTYVQNPHTHACFMYVDGESWPVDHLDIAKTLCSKRCIHRFVYQSLARQFASFIPLVEQLFSARLLYIDDGLDEDEDGGDYDYADDDRCDEGDADAHAVGTIDLDL